jgi:hypothetical protein
MSNRLPAVTSQVPRDLRNFLDRVRDILKAVGSQQLITAEQLEQLNLLRIDAQGRLLPTIDGGDGGTTGGKVLPTPPVPQNLAATAAIQNIIVEWDTPNYRGHAYTEVWSAGVDDLSQAVLIGSAPGGIYVDSVGPSVTRYYWARFVNEEDTRGAFNSISGVPATTGSDLAYTMDLLSDTFGGTSEAPFFQLDAPTVIDGVTIPAGTYIKSAFIYDGVITNAKIANLAVDNAKIANLSADKINAGFLSADRIQAGSIDAKIANLDAAIITSGFINTARIQDASITTAKIGDAQITNAKIANAAITTAKIGDAQITNAKIANAAITTAKIGDAQITTAKIADAAIGTAKIGDAAITTAKIGLAQVDTLQIAGNAVTIPVSAFSAGSVSTGSGGWVIVQSLDINADGAPISIFASLNYFMSQTSPLFAAIFDPSGNLITQSLQFQSATLIGYSTLSGTFTLRVNRQGPAATSCDNRLLVCLGTRR